MRTANPMARFYNVCPKTDPSQLGINSVYDALVSKDENWSNCAEYIKAHPCEELGFAPPGDKSAEFYAPGNFPENGTQTLSNVAGAITSPVSGAVYTYTLRESATVISVASAKAKPTDKGGNSKGSDGDTIGDGKSDPSKTGSSKSSETSSAGGSSSSGGSNSGDDKKDDEEDAAMAVVPKLVFVVVPVLVAAVLL